MFIMQNDTLQSDISVLLKQSYNYSLRKNLENIENTYESKMSQMLKENTSLNEKLTEADADKEKLLMR